MASRAFENAMKMRNVETLFATKKFDTTEDTTSFDLGELDLTGAGLRISAILNGSVLEASDISVNADDNTMMDTAKAVPADNTIIFKIYTK